MKKFDLFSRIAEKGFAGIDTDLRESLFEYGFIAVEHMDIYQGKKFKELFVYLLRPENRIDWGYISYKDIDIAPLESWFDKKGFFEFLGDNYKDWRNSRNYVSKLFDLFQYYGAENFGFSCYGDLSFIEFARIFKANK